MSYCYVGRFNKDKVYLNQNTEVILKSVSNWIKDKPWPKIPNQTDNIYYTFDIGSSTDVPLHSKLYDWQPVFDFFNDHPRAKSTFATKYPTKFKVEEYNLVKEKNRIRVSLIPQKYSNILEPNTDLIKNRIDCITKLQNYMEVHINFSPIIYEENWLKEYENLFKLLKEKNINVPCECIFLTYNDIQYARNSSEVNALCWKPDIQEYKNSQYAADNIRYQWKLKNEMIHDFKKLYSKYFNLQTIRYIF